MTADATRLRQALESWSFAVQRQAVETTAGLARATGDVPVDSGELRGAIRTDGLVRQGGSTFTGRVVAPVIQAVTTDKGARPHKITPRRAGGTLVFYWPKAGGVVGFRSVNHPGNPPRPWWQRVIGRSYEQALRLAARTVPFG